MRNRSVSWLLSTKAIISETASVLGLKPLWALPVSLVWPDKSPLSIRKLAVTLRFLPWTFPRREAMS